MCSSLRFPENLSYDGETASLLSGEIFRDQITVRATEVVDAVGPILADVNLAIGIGDLVDDVHRRIRIIEANPLDVVYVAFQSPETSK